MQFVPSGFGKKNRAFFSSDVSQTPETFIFPPFPRREEAPVLGALGRDPHAYVRALTERQQQEMEKKGRRCREGKTSGNAKRLQGIKTTCLHTSSTPRRLVLEAAQPPGLEAACSRFLEKLCVLGAKEDSFSSGRSHETLSRTWSWGLSVCRTGASVCLTA